MNFEHLFVKGLGMFFPNVMFLLKLAKPCGLRSCPTPPCFPCVAGWRGELEEQGGKIMG